MKKVFLGLAVAVLLMPPMHAKFREGVTASISHRPFFMQGYQQPYYYDINVPYLAAIEATLLACAFLSSRRREGSD